MTKAIRDAAPYLDTYTPKFTTKPMKRRADRPKGDRP